MQGFLRSNIDIPVVRADRHRLAGMFATYRVNKKLSPTLPIEVGSGNELLSDYRKVVFDVEFC